MLWSAFAGSFPRCLYGCRAIKVVAIASFLHRNVFNHWPAACSFHTTFFVYKKRKTREEKKYKNIITFKPKSKNPVIHLWPGMTVAELSRETDRKLPLVFEAISYLDNAQMYNSPSSRINNRIALQAIAKTLGYRVQFIKPNEDAAVKKIPELKKRPPPDPSTLVKRPPVVTIMGHVDHGKTTLLDALRNSNIVAQEHGGITQHIGAFTVKLPEGSITFLDTPGHAAFRTMRSRGAHATDIVVLVVAADDGVMEQTIESVKFAKEANVPIIVAINKIDKAHADTKKISQELMEFCGLQLEEIGGEVISVCISALKRLNLDHLTEAILTLAEVMEIAGDPTGHVEGIVLESSVESSKGKLSTALIQRGCLKKGDILVAGLSWGKVREMLDENGVPLPEASPGTPCQIVGWKTIPSAGEIILQASSEKEARSVVEYREKLQQEEKMQSDLLEIEQKRKQHFEQYNKERAERLLQGRHRKWRNVGARPKEIQVDTHPTLSVVLKGDVHGSVEAILEVLNTYKSHDNCRLDIIHSGIGNVNENDIVLAECFEGIIYCFSVEIPSAMKQLAEESSIQIKRFDVIYHLVDDVKEEINSRLPLARKENIIGEALVLQEFLVSVGKKKVPVAGCKCTKGMLQKAKCKVLRSDETIYEGEIISLKHEKSDVESIKKNVECGLRVEDTSFTYLPGDVIVCFTEEFVPQKTDWNPGF